MPEFESVSRPRKTVYAGAMGEPLESPCVKVCTYDAGKGICLGCGRTLEEIATWSAMTEAQRRAVMEQAPQRLR